MATKTFMLLALVALLATQPNVRADEGDVATEADEYEDVERALLVVRKSVNTDYVVAGRNVTVTIDIFNAGQR